PPAGTPVTLATAPGWTGCWSTTPAMAGANPPTIKLRVVTPWVAGSAALTTIRSPGNGSPRPTEKAPEADAITSCESTPPPWSCATSTRAPATADPDSTDPASVAARRYRKASGTEPT